ncbi:hypothetical protein TNCV_2752091 [Trichonephila clavipes]|nr:hypothetical protein TNCV_2752091 [Trichonephila clavipes]
MSIHRRLIERNLRSHHLPLTPVNCRARLQVALSGWNRTEWRRIMSSDESRFQLCPDDYQRMSGDAQGSVTILLSQLHAARTLNQELWSWVPFFLTTGLLLSSLELHLQHNGTSRHSENCFATIPFAVPWA